MFGKEAGGIETITNEPIVGSVYRLNFNSSVTEVEDVNSSFAKGFMKVAYHGGNRNGVYISKNAFNEAIQSMYNCPIVCRYDRETDSIGAHDCDIVSTDSAIKLVNTTNPVGVIPESANVWWEDILESDGVTTHEYLCTDILLWKRQEAFEHIKSNGVTDESMEIKVLGGSKQKDGYYHVDKFEFTAFCLLESAPPCFESAGIELFSLNEFKEKYIAMMDDFKREFSMVTTASADDDILHNQSFPKGGKYELDVNELLNKYNLTAEDIDFDMEGMDASELEARFAVIKESKEHVEVPAEKPAEESVEEQEGKPVLDGEQPTENHEVDAEEQPVEEPAVEKYSLSADQMQKELEDALQANKFHDDYWGEDRATYHLVDYDAEFTEVYMMDVRDWNIYGAPYSMNGDHAVVDFDKAKRKKIVYADFDEGEQVPEINVFKDVEEQFSIRVSKLNDEINELKQFKYDVENKEAQAKREELFASFSDMEGIEAFDALKMNCGDMSIEDIEEKCFAIRGRNMNKIAKFSMTEQSGAIRLPIEKAIAEDDVEPYGGVVARYGAKK